MSEVRSISDKYLHSGRDTSSGNRAYFCPFCKHRKRKLEVNITTGQWHCWACNVKGKTINSLLSKIGIEERVKVTTVVTTKSYVNQCRLPIEYYPLWIPRSTFEYKHALQYVVQKRGLTTIDIIRYKIGYCEEGKYQHMIIIPSYDQDDNLNYFVARSYKTKFFAKPTEYNADIIPFDSYINWNEPVTLTESPFNAITAVRNAVPLYGKNILPKLMSKIATSPTKYVNLAFDGDAPETTLNVANKIISIGKIPRYIRIEDQDPNELGSVEMTTRTLHATPMDEYDIMKNKLFSL